MSREDSGTISWQPSYSLFQDPYLSALPKGVVVVKENVRGVCRDPGEDMFLACALSGSAQFIVSGDEDLTDLKRYKTVRIIKAPEFLRLFA